MGWREKAKKDSQGRWLKFTEETPKHVVTFIAEPNVIEKTSTMGERKGEKYNAYEFPVLCENEEKILSVTQRSLLRLIVDEDEEESIIGKTFSIKCLDLTKKTTWKLKEVSGPDITKWKPTKEKDEDEDEDDTGKAEDKDEQDEKAKAKFKEEVKKRAKKVKAQEKKEKEEEAKNGAQSETEDGSGEEKESME